MSASHSIPLADVDLRLLRVCGANVQGNGFSAAEEAFGCRRPPSRCTCATLRAGLARGCANVAGRQVHPAMLDLFGALQRFNSAVADARGEMIGELAFGKVDAMATNGRLGLDRALAIGRARCCCRGPLSAFCPIASPPRTKRRAGCAPWHRRAQPTDAFGRTAGRCDRDDQRPDRIRAASRRGSATSGLPDIAMANMLFSTRRRG